MTLHWGATVEQIWHVEEVLWLGNEAKVGVDWPVITTPVLFPRLVLADCHRAIRIVLHQDAVRVRWALIFLVDVVIVIFLAFVGRHKGDLTLLVAREVCLVLRLVELVKLLELLR